MMMKKQSGVELMDGFINNQIKTVINQIQIIRNTTLFIGISHYNRVDGLEFQINIMLPLGFREINQIRIIINIYLQRNWTINSNTIYIPQWPKFNLSLHFRLMMHMPQSHLSLRTLYIHLRTLLSYLMTMHTSETHKSMKFLSSSLCHLENLFKAQVTSINQIKESINRQNGLKRYSTS